MVDEKYLNKNNSDENEEEDGEDFSVSKAGFQGRPEKSKEEDKKIRLKKPKPTPVIIGEDVEVEKEQLVPQEKANMNALINLYDELVKLGVYDKNAIIGVMTEDDEFAEHNTTKEEFLKFLEERLLPDELAKELVQHMEKELVTKKEKLGTEEKKTEEPKKEKLWKGAFQIGQEVIGKNKKGKREEGWRVVGRMEKKDGEIGSYVLEKGEKGEEIRIHIDPNELVELNWPKGTETASTVEKSVEETEDKKEESEITKPVLPKMSIEEATQAKEKNKQEITPERVEKFVNEFDVKQKALTNEQIEALLNEALTEKPEELEKGLAESVLGSAEWTKPDTEPADAKGSGEAKEEKAVEKISEKNKLGLKVFKENGPLTRGKFAYLYFVEKKVDKKEGEEVFDDLRKNGFIEWSKGTIEWDKKIKEKLKEGEIDDRSKSENKIIEEFVLSSKGKEAVTTLTIEEKPETEVPPVEKKDGTVETETPVEQVEEAGAGKNIITKKIERELRGKPDYPADFQKKKANKEKPIVERKKVPPVLSINDINELLSEGYSGESEKEEVEKISEKNKLGLKIFQKSKESLTRGKFVYLYFVEKKVDKVDKKEGEKVFDNLRKEGFIEWSKETIEWGKKIQEKFKEGEINDRSKPENKIIEEFVLSSKGEKIVTEPTVEKKLETKVPPVVEKNKDETVETKTPVESVEEVAPTAEQKVAKTRIDLALDAYKKLISILSHEESLDLVKVFLKDAGMSEEEFIELLKEKGIMKEKKLPFSGRENRSGGTVETEVPPVEKKDGTVETETPVEQVEEAGAGKNIITKKIERELRGKPDYPADFQKKKANKEKPIVERKKVPPVLSINDINELLSEGYSGESEKEEVEKISEKNKLGLKIFQKSKESLTRGKFVYLYFVEKKVDKVDKKEGEKVFDNLRKEGFIEWSKETIEWGKKIQEKFKEGEINDRSKPENKIIEEFVLSSKGEKIVTEPTVEKKLETKVPPVVEKNKDETVETKTPVESVEEVAPTAEQKVAKTRIDLALDAYKKASSEYSHQESLDLAMKLLEGASMSEEEFIELLKEKGIIKEEDLVEQKDEEEKSSINKKEEPIESEEPEEDEKNRFRIGETLFETGDYVKIKRISGDIENYFVIKKIVYNSQPARDKAPLTVQGVKVENKKVKKFILLDDLLELNPLGSVAEAEVIETKKDKYTTTQEAEPKDDKEVEIPKEIREASVEGGLEKFNISLEDMKIVRGFNELSESQKFLVLENLKQITLGRTQDASRADYHEDLFNVGFLSRIWKGITKQYQIAKKEKEELSEIKAGGIEMHKDVLQQLVNGIEIFNTEVEMNEKGELEIQYASGLEHVHESVVKKFNKVATKFSKTPHEWSYKNTASSKDIEKWSKVKEDYEKARGELMENMLHDENAEEKIFEIDRNVQFNQFLNTNPEVEKELENISDKGLWRKVLKNTLTEKGIYTGAGFITRTVTASLLGAIAVPVVAGLVGGFMARKRGKESLVEREKLERKGTKDESKETHDFVDAKNLSKRLKNFNSYLIKHNFFNEDEQSDEDREKIEKTLNSLKERVNYTLEKIDGGLVNFGEENKRIVNHYELMHNLAHANILINSREIIGNKEVAERLEKFLGRKHKRITEEQAIYLKKQMYKGFAVGMTFATLGRAVREGAEYFWGGKDASIIEPAPVSTKTSVAESTPTEAPAPETPLSMLEDEFTGERNLDKKVVAGKQLIDRYEQRGDNDLADALRDEVEGLKEQIENQKTSEPEIISTPEPESEIKPETLQETFTIKNREWVRGENEQMLKWGGVKRTGVDVNGNFVLDIKDMLEEKNVQGLMEDGKEVKILFSTGENQQEVTSLSVDKNGKLIIPKDSNLFTAENGKAVFHGKNMEVAIVDEKIDGPEDVKILATVQGDNSIQGTDKHELITDKHESQINTEDVSETDKQPVGRGMVEEQPGNQETDISEAERKAEEINQKANVTSKTERAETEAEVIESTPPSGTQTETSTEISPADKEALESAEKIKGIQPNNIYIDKEGDHWNIVGTDENKEIHKIISLEKGLTKDEAASRMLTYQAEFKENDIPFEKAEEVQSLVKKTGLSISQVTDNFKAVDKKYFEENMQVALLNIFNKKGDASEILGDIDKNLNVIKSVSTNDKSGILFNYKNGNKITIRDDIMTFTNTESGAVQEAPKVISNKDFNGMKEILKDPEKYFSEGEGTITITNFVEQVIDDSKVNFDFNYSVEQVKKASQELLDGRYGQESEQTGLVRLFLNNKDINAKEFVFGDAKMDQVEVRPVDGKNILDCSYNKGQNHIYIGEGKMGSDLNNMSDFSVDGFKKLVDNISEKK